MNIAVRADSNDWSKPNRTTTKVPTDVNAIAIPRTASIRALRHDSKLEGVHLVRPYPGPRLDPESHRRKTIGEEVDPGSAGA